MTGGGAEEMLSEDLRPLQDVITEQTMLRGVYVQSWSDEDLEELARRLHSAGWSSPQVALGRFGSALLALLSNPLWALGNLGWFAAWIALPALFLVLAGYDETWPWLSALRWPGVALAACYGAGFLLRLTITSRFEARFGLENAQQRSTLRRKLASVQILLALALGAFGVLMAFQAETLVTVWGAVLLLLGWLLANSYKTVLLGANPDFGADIIERPGK